MPKMQFETKMLSGFLIFVFFQLAASLEESNKTLQHNNLTHNDFPMIGNGSVQSM